MQYTTKKQLTLIVALLLAWTSLASAFTAELKQAAQAVYDGTATGQQKALVLMNYQKLNLMGLSGDTRGGLTDAVYQANQKFFAEFNDTVSRETLTYMGMDGTLPAVKDRYKAGTDTDINVQFQNERSLRVKDLQEMRDYYNVAYRRHLEDQFDVSIKENVNWAATNETDFMPDTQYIDQREFTHAAKFVNKEGGWMYENPKAVEVEIHKNLPGYKIDAEGAQAYAQEMLDNIEKKGEKMAKHRTKLRELMNERNFAADDATQQQVQIEINETRAQVQLDQSQMAKYMDRLDDLNQRLRKQNGLPDLPEATGVTALAGDVSKNRGPSTATQAMELAANKDALQQHYMKNLSQTYAEIATTAADPEVRAQYLQEAAQTSQKHLSPDAQKQFMQEVTDVYGKNSPVVKELNLEVKRAKAQQQMESLTPGLKVVGVAGFINDAFDVYDTYQEGGASAVATQVGMDMVTGKVMETVTSRFIAAVPSAGPALAVAGAGMTSYQLTRNVMSRVTIGDKTLDEHTQEGIDNALYVSAADKQTRDANLTKMLTKLLQNDKFSLPEGMTLKQAQQQVLANADQGGSLFDFLEGAPEVQPKVEKQMTLDDISLDRIEGQTPEEQERDAALTKQLMELLKGGRYELPAGMTVPQARKLVLLNSRAGKDKFGFLIDKEKRRQEQMAALEKWKADINPDRPYQFISCRDQAFKLTQSGLRLSTTVVWSVTKRNVMPEGGIVLYRDGEPVAAVRVDKIKGRYEEDPMNKGQWLLYTGVSLTDSLQDLNQQLLPPETHFYHMTWHLFDDQGKPNKMVGKTEQAVTYAVFPRYQSDSEILLCNDDGVPLEDNEQTKKLQAHLAAHYHALGVTPEPSVRMADVEVEQVELPAVLFSSYRELKQGGFNLDFYTQAGRLGARTFDAQGKMIGQSLGRVGLVYHTSQSTYDGQARQEVRETWYDQQGQNHGPSRTLIDGKVKLDEFYKHGQKHGRQVRADYLGRPYGIETYKDGQKHGLVETFYTDSGTPTGVTRIKTFYQEDVEIGPREEFYEDGGKKLYAEYARLDGQSVKHGQLKSWNEAGKLLKHESYRNGTYDGRCMYYSDNGDVTRETNYSDGLKQGEERIYHDNSQLASVIPYDGDKAVGVGVFYHQSGAKSRETLYRDGQQIGDLQRWEAYQKPADWTGSERLVYEATYGDAGCLTQETIIRYDDDKPKKVEQAYMPKGDLDVSRWVCSDDGKSVKHGLERIYLGSQMTLERHWNRGEYHGMTRRWYESGQLQEEEPFQQGTKHGLHRKWDGYGNLILSETLENGLVTGERIELGKKSGYDIPVIYTTHHVIEDGKSVAQGLKEARQVKLIEGKYVSHGVTTRHDGKVLVYQGSFNEGKPHGKFIRPTESGGRESEYLVDGKRDGSYELWDADGRSLKKGTYKAGLIEKMVEYGQLDDRCFYKEVRNNITDGQEVERYYQYYEYLEEDGKKVKHGHFESHASDHTERTETYDHGQKTGAYSKTYSNGQLQEEGVYLDGKQHGLYHGYDRDGQLMREIQYDHGLNTHAKYFSQQDDGETVREKFWVVIDGQAKNHGTWTYKKGDQLLELDNYDKGLEHGEKSRWDADGSLNYTHIYDQGVKVKATEFSRYDEKVRRSEYQWLNIDGKSVKHGVQLKFTNDQNVREEHYDHGLKTGVWKSWSEDGRLIREDRYENDQKVN